MNWRCVAEWGALQAWSAAFNSLEKRTTKLSFVASPELEAEVWRASDTIEAATAVIARGAKLLGLTQRGHPFAYATANTLRSAKRN